VKYLVKFFVVTFLVLISTYSFAEQKIVVLDMKFVLNNSKAGKGAQDFLQKSYIDNQKKFSDLEKELKKEESDLLKQKTVLDKNEYTKKTDELRKKVIDFQSQRRTAIDKIATQRAESRETLMNQIAPIVDTYIKENGISLVMDKKNVVGGLNEFDITKVIIEKLDKVLPSLNLK